jgi:hypothetical protein
VANFGNIALGLGSEATNVTVGQQLAYEKARQRRIDLQDALMNAQRIRESQAQIEQERQRTSLEGRRMAIQEEQEKYARQRQLKQIFTNPVTGKSYAVYEQPDTGQVTTEEMPQLGVGSAAQQQFQQTQELLKLGGYTPQPGQPMTEQMRDYLATVEGRPSTRSNMQDYVDFAKQLPPPAKFKVKTWDQIPEPTRSQAIAETAMGLMKTAYGAANFGWYGSRPPRYNTASAQLAQFRIHNRIVEQQLLPLKASYDRRIKFQEALATNLAERLAQQQMINMAIPQQVLDSINKQIQTALQTAADLEAEYEGIATQRQAGFADPMAGQPGHPAPTAINPSVDEIERKLQKVEQGVQAPPKTP